MATEDRPPPHHLNWALEQRDQLRRSGIFPIARGIEARAAHLPRLGFAHVPSQDSARLHQKAELAFPSATVTDIAVSNGVPEIEGSWLGLLGPMGPMPLHLTEFAIFERRYAKTRPFGRWLDMLSGRMLQGFYRAWADSQPAASADRPADDHFACYLGALTGAVEGVAQRRRGRSPLPAEARLHYAALFVGNRSAVNIEDALEHLLGQEVRVLEYQPRWRVLEQDDHSRLGRQFATLGTDLMLGGRTRSASDAFRVVVRARSLRDYQDLLPTGRRFALAAEALDAFAPSHLEWDIAIELDSRHARPAKLDRQARLGWTSWLGKRPGGGMRQDVHLTRHVGMAA